MQATYSAAAKCDSQSNSQLSALLPLSPSRSDAKNNLSIVMWLLPSLAHLIVLQILRFSARLLVRVCFLCKKKLFCYTALLFFPKIHRPREVILCSNAPHSQTIQLTQRRGNFRIFLIDEQSYSGHVIHSVAPLHFAFLRLYFHTFMSNHSLLSFWTFCGEVGILWFLQSPLVVEWNFHQNFFKKF